MGSIPKLALLNVTGAMVWNVAAYPDLTLLAYNSHHLTQSVLLLLLKSDSYTAANGTIYSPNYPCDYCNNLDITYIILAPTISNITLTISSINLDSSGDYLRVSGFASSKIR